jgi:prephenate dehydrogenase
MKPTCLGLIGVGRLGAALAGRATEAGVKRIVGYSQDRVEAVEAARRGLISDVATTAEQVVRVADFVVIVQNVSETIALLRRLADVLMTGGVFCTDLGPVKEPVVKAAASLGLGEYFAGSHAFIGNDRSDSTKAGEDRFREIVVYVTPVEEDSRAANEVADFWKRVLGGAPVICDAETHDRLVGWTSHLPRAIASGLALTLAEHGPKGVTYDPDALLTTAAAAGDVDTWADNLIHNRSRLIDAIGATESGLQRLKSALVAGDSGAVRGWLMEGHRWRIEADK